MRRRRAEIIASGVSFVGLLTWLAETSPPFPMFAALAAILLVPLLLLAYDLGSIETWEEVLDKAPPASQNEAVDDHG